MKNYKTMNMTQKKGLIILGILLTACIFSMWFFLNSQRPSGEIKKDVGGNESALTANALEVEQPSGEIKGDVGGNKSALTANEVKVEQKSSAIMPAEKVIIKAYLNLGSGCQKETTDLLDNLAKEYSGKVFVEYIDFSTKEGAERTGRDGLSCAGLIINGKQTYAIIDKNGARKDVTFSHPINAQYTADDVKTVVKMLLGE